MSCDLNSQFDCHHGPLGPSLTEACPGAKFFAFMSLLNALFLKNEKISGRCERVVPVERPDDEYDFIVVGGGAAGCAVAARLTEIPDWKVLLLEAGADEPVGAQAPAFVSQFLKTSDMWNYTTSNEKYACLETNGFCAWPQGKNLGGNTAHNAMIYLRGNPRDYDHWAELGNKGWDWKTVERYFKKGEHNGEIHRVGRKHHATRGPLSVGRFPYLVPLAYELQDAAIEAGFGVSEDLNGDVKSGFSDVQGMQEKGLRHSSSRSYLWPVRHRKNLHVSLNSYVTRVIFRNRRAVGVEYYKDGKLRRVRATKEVVLSAGIVESPHLLLLSGIGPRKHLESKDVEVVHHLPGVGENLHDHPGVSIPCTLNEPDLYDLDYESAAQYLVDQTGPASNFGLDSLVIMLPTKRATRSYPDIEVYFDGSFTNCAPGPVGARQSNGRRVVNVVPTMVLVKSRGRVTLKSKDPFEDPLMTVNYLKDPEDLERLVEGIKITLTMLETDTLRHLNFTLRDGPLEACAHFEFRSDEYWGCFARQQNYALYHQGGSCKMGPSSDPMAVVDPRLRVYGMKGLRVVDNSIMPQVPTCNTAGPAMMIGERGADFIKEDWDRNNDMETFYYHRD